MFFKRDSTVLFVTSKLLPVSLRLSSPDRWVVECGEVFRQQRDSWAHLIPTSPGESAVLAEHFFNCACSLMARQLRETVENSLADFLSFLQLYKGGNDYQGDFQDLLFVFQPVSLVVFSLGPRPDLGTRLHGIVEAAACLCLVHTPQLLIAS